MKCVILQPSYIPWRGYFHQIYKCDLFVFLDDVMYDERGWRNRNRVKHAGGSRWLTIPVHSKGSRISQTLIGDMLIAWDVPWSRKHEETLRHAYHAAPYYERYRDLLKTFYARRDRRLADFTIDFTVALAGELGLGNRQFARSSEYRASGGNNDRLLKILQHVGATSYLTGPSARTYLDENRFARAGISVEYMDYRYPEYPQLHPPYDPHVSILDLLVMTGPRALDYIIHYDTHRSAACATKACCPGC